MKFRDRKHRIGRFSDGQETSQLHPRSQPVGRFSTGQEMLPEGLDHHRTGRFSTGQETSPDEAGNEARQVRVDHGLPEMGFRAAFARRRDVTSRASAQGLIEAANRAVFHDRGYTLTWDTETGDLWLTPTTNPRGWWYEEDAG